MDSTDFAHEVGHIAQSFVDARRAGRSLPDYPGTVPTALADAYAVQDAAIALNEAEIGGWKVGRINPPIDGVDRLAGPIFSRQIVEEAAEPVAMPVFVGGFAAAEAEFLLRIGATPPAGKMRFTHEEAAALIDAVHVGIEIASSPLAAINELGAAVTVSDFGNNNGLVIGAAIPDWRNADIDNWPLTVAIDGETIGSGKAADMLDGPIGAARFLFELMAERGIALKPGQWISSGAVTGVHAVRIGDRIEARFSADLAVACTIKAS
ncbi:MAG: 2-keto-4-pentenoate hydratase [Sphingomonas bacterium]|uniref:2-keto-4-pentenoate hydratase n=1 Tax=Sphingomonas bacterium TaxID=1895847 RepID=UPI00261B5B6B|nr:fumarylacetoacetate hydrolase family protein [Sphingomonas bacterium]MDB5706784.1 2-keto-4-pentenoate hydratase [Sphingomonas bacterium]